MEEDRGSIQDLMTKYGLEEEEARAYYHLEAFRQIITELYDADLPNNFARSFFRATYVAPHLSALYSLLRNRVLRRDYPEGWGGGFEKPEP